MVLMGIDPTEVRAGTAADPAAFAAGTLGFDRLGNIYRYVQADATGVTGLGYAVIMKPGQWIADMATSVVSAPGIAQGAPVGFAQAAIAANGYGWVLVCGRGSVFVATLCARGTALTTTGTDGLLDDATTAGLEVVEGVSLEAANSGGASALAAAYVNWPYIGRTL